MAPRLTNGCSNFALMAMRSFALSHSYSEFEDLLRHEVGFSKGVWLDRVSLQNLLCSGGLQALMVFEVCRSSSHAFI